ncbi:tyrosine-type recombinase/integrase [Azohydromonas sp.]|uniref:tyrosine-type recombinase/integrase n=1 Tax=Azohydromonas sp. TaxID=1872666 RepID=UPI002BD26CCB|nr:tyrosine-type recombinase/integrase [Azohydromonas sp.]HMM84665.1 tyrosine-type recombinase/integrase [Azohydromonas sp.]
MPATISTVAARSKLKPRHEPYFTKLQKGLYLGFQRLSPASVGTWIARSRDPDTGKQTKRSLGDFAHLPASDRFDAAVKAASEWFAHLGRGGSATPISVRTACENYLKHVRTRKGEDAAKDIKKRYERWVYADAALADTPLEKLTRPRIEAWRTRLASTPARVDRSKEGERRVRPRAPASVNRDMVALRAALNHAHDAGYVTSDMAWRVALRPIRNADGRRETYLDAGQRRSLIDKAPADVGAFLRGLALVPLRPGALASLTVASYDKRLGVLSIGKDKAGRDRRIKLPASTAAFFEAQTVDKLPAAPLFSRADGKAWGKDAWKWPIKEAAAAARLGEQVTAYTLRHSVITDLVTQGLDLLTVAQLSGTSVAMIERHYGHLRADHAAAALATLAV